jgi:hypothetical protein
LPPALAGLAAGNAVEFFSRPSRTIPSGSRDGGAGAVDAPLPLNSGDTANGTTAIFASIFGSTSCTWCSTIGPAQAKPPSANPSASARLIR